MATKVFKGVKSTALPDTYVNSPVSVAPLFSASTAYAKGDQVYNGLKLYRFTANHAAGAWTGSDVEEVTVGGQLKTLNEDTTNLKQDLTQQLLINDEVPNTVQSYTFSDGSVSQIVHKRSGTTIRTDVFTYGTSSITEVRTLNTGESLTIVTNLETLETSITYAA